MDYCRCVLAAAARGLRRHLDIPDAARYMARVRDLGLHEACFILIGVGPLASPRAARWMRANVPGVHIPDVLESRVTAHDAW